MYAWSVSWRGVGKAWVGNEWWDESGFEEDGEEL